MIWNEVFSKDNPFKDRIEGALNAYMFPNVNVSSGAYFWQNPNISSYFSTSEFTNTVSFGNTSFYIYSNPNRRYP